MNHWDDLKIEDFDSDNMQVMTEIIGLEAMKKLIETFGGEMLYIQKSESVIRMARDRKINNEFDGANFQELAHRYNLTSRHIREIIAQKRSKTARPKQEQFELF